MSIYNHFSEQDIQVLKARAQRVASAAQDSAQAHEQLTVLQVTVANEHYALPIHAVLAVYDEVVITPLPCVPDTIAGLVNLRGHLIPIVDLGVLLGSGGSHGDFNTIVVVASQDVQIALLVQSVNEVKALLAKDVLALPTTLEIINETYFQGVLDNGTVLVNVDAVLNDPQLVINQTVP